MPTPAEQLAALAANRYGQPIPLAPDGRAWDAVVSQLATAAQREAVLTVPAEGTGLYNFPFQIAAYGPNLTVCEINSECDEWEIAFNEPRNWQTLSVGQSWVGQIFSRIFIQSKENPAVEPSEGDSIRISYGSAFLLNPVSTLASPDIIVRQTVGHFLNGLILAENPKRIKTQICACPIASSNFGTDLCGFGASLVEAQDANGFARNLVTNFGSIAKGFPFFDGNAGGSFDNIENDPKRFFPDNVMFWDGTSGPINPQATQGFRLQVEMSGSSPIYMDCRDASNVLFQPFSTTPGFLMFREFIQR